MKFKSKLFIPLLALMFVVIGLFVAKAEVADAAGYNIEISNYDYDNYHSIPRVKTPLAGAKFEVWTNGFQKLMGTVTTNGSGKATVYNLSPGIYYVKQIQAPAGYPLVTNVGTVYISCWNEEVVFTNQKAKMGTLQIIKTDESNNRLAGAVFKVYTQGTGIDMGTVATNSNGVATISLPQGNYRVREDVAPPGYELDQTFRDVTIGSAVTTLNVTNKKKPVVVQRGTIGIYKRDVSSQQLLSGAVFQVKNAAGAVVGTVVTNTNGYASLANLDYGVYTLTEIQAPSGYQALTSTQTVYLNTASTTTTFYNQKIAAQKGTLTINKLDQANNQPLSGAVFQVRNASGTLVGSVTTNNLGVATLSNLDYGTYTVTETVAPSGYQILTTSQAVSINSASKSVTFYNKKIATQKGTLTINKLDQANNQPLAGAIFQVKDSSGASVGIISSGNDGRATLSDLAYGTYTITELVAPTGYQIVYASYTTQIDSANKSINFYNKKLETSKGSIEIKKLEYGTNKVLAGAEFEVKNAQGTVVGTGTSDTNGLVTISGLEYGTYTVTETKAPNGYQALMGAQNVSLNSAKSSITFYNKKLETPKGSLEIVKTDEKGKLLSGAVFHVLSTTTGTMEMYETGVDGPEGKIILENLAYGEYKVIETKAPDGYIGDYTVKDVTVDKDKVTLTVINKQKTGSIEIVKTDEEGNKLQGAKFYVWSMQDGQRTDVETGVDGKALLENLPYGKYKIAEYQAPNGYEGDYSIKEITVDRDKVTLTVINKKQVKNGELIITKYAYDESGYPTDIVLKDAEYTITNTQGFTEVATTNDKGVINLTLEPGTYTVVETKAPNGYIIDNTPYTVIITEGQKTEIDLYNLKEGEPGGFSIYVREVDAKNQLTNHAVEGAKFEVITSDGTWHRDLVSDKNGRVQVDSMSVGRYTVIQIACPPNYVLAENQSQIQIGTMSEGDTVKLNYFNRYTGSSK
ncbi:SpaA isopeptide-forming pilin-related protein [Enterococcus termitis]|uniref:SpaA-like prealbumin fold domain-containing protein n=1 Tax=Enterococcus termitis TaxID=332950 RepID=A0A1E5GHS5_9ENTE|nr:SpaA isopeptide-forming pilin-related protein [Enterococcus termitis]OEG12276.1 hypothetical protein BCR25_06955 [Enterococcus termitis]